MPVAIHTKYIGPSNVKGSRIKAYTHRGFCDGKPVIWSVTVPYDHSGEEHEKAAKALLSKHWPEWRAYSFEYVGGSADGLGDVYSVNP